jgi:hypothetical protein
VNDELKRREKIGVGGHENRHVVLFRKEGGQGEIDGELNVDTLLARHAELVVERSGDDLDALTIGVPPRIELPTIRGVRPWILRLARAARVNAQGFEAPPCVVRASDCERLRKVKRLTFPSIPEPRKPKASRAVR